MPDWEQLTSGPGHAEFALPLEYQGWDDIFYHHHIRKGNDHFYLGDPELDALVTKSGAWAKREAEHEAQVRELVIRFRATVDTLEQIDHRFGRAWPGDVWQESANAIDGGNKVLALFGED